MQMNNFEFEYKRRRLTEATSGEMIWTLLCQLRSHAIESAFAAQQASQEASKSHSKCTQFYFLLFYFYIHVSANNNKTARETRMEIYKEMRSSATQCEHMTHTTSSNNVIFSFQKTFSRNS